MNRIILPSPAKLNLYLRVLSKRKDGFHNILTLFQRIDLCDQITLTELKTDTITISCDHPHVPLGTQNIAHQAAMLLKKRFKINKGINIDIKKKIPVAAGLAGGSSNAATVLQGINKFWKLGLNLKELLPLASKLGSDVSFFLYNTSWAIGSKRGNIIQPLKISQKLCQILIVPCVKLYSGEIYDSLKLKLTKRMDNVNILTRHLEKGDILALSQLLINDLEASVIHSHPPLAALKKRLLSAGSRGVLISGSGPSIFGVVKTDREAKQLQSRFLRQYRRVFVVKTL